MLANFQFVKRSIFGPTCPEVRTVPLLRLGAKQPPFHQAFRV